MQLYRVTNGYHGNGPVYVLVIAASEADAIQQASVSFEADRQRRLRRYGPYPLNHPGLPASFSDPAHLEAELLCPDTSEPWANEPDE